MPNTLLSSVIKISLRFCDQEEKKKEMRLNPTEATTFI